MTANRSAMKVTASDAMREILASCRIVDLSVLTAGNLPCVPAEGVQFGLSLMNWFTWPRGPYVEYTLVHDDHTGTHCDAPGHMVPAPETNLPYAHENGRITLEKVPVEQLMGPAAVIDVRHLLQGTKPGKRTVFESSPVIGVKDVRGWEEKYGPLQMGDVVLFYTSWSDLYYRRYPEGFKFDRSHPAPEAETIEYIASKGVKHIGTDGVGIGQLQDDYPTHRAAGRNGIVVTEKLTNLGELPPRGAFFIFLPHKVEGVCGGPGRAIAIVSR